MTRTWKIFDSRYRPTLRRRHGWGLAGRFRGYYDDKLGGDFPPLASFYRLRGPTLLA